MAEASVLGLLVQKRLSEQISELRPGEKELALQKAGVEHPTQREQHVQSLSSGKSWTYRRIRKRANMERHQQRRGRGSRVRSQRFLHRM